MTNFALVPGAGGSGWYWHRVVPELVARGHRAVGLSLPSGDDTADFPAYVDACVEQLTVAGIGDDTLVVVGQSLGGFTAPVLAERLDADRIVLLNAMIPLPRETPGHWFTTSGAGAARAELAAAQGRTLGDDIDVIADFFHDVPEDVVSEALSQGEPEQSEFIMGCQTPFDAWPAPVRVVSGRDDRFFPFDFQRRIAAERLGVDVHPVPGGHLAALACPVEVAEALIVDNR
ncbi:alpha/beta hydrolase family protein [Gordonia sp. CPCC 205515]|uniref:alpha/beta fold hydrolase n=1 Tax=Gordonia sp. CPCC 205515 TaxID=3140791 RepID=UPI003AF3B8A0